MFDNICDNIYTTYMTQQLYYILFCNYKYTRLIFAPSKKAAKKTHTFSMSDSLRKSCLIKKGVFGVN